MSKNPTKNQDTGKNYENMDDVLQELVLIRKLLIIILVKLGSDSGEIGKAIDISPRTLRDWISFNGIVATIEKTEQKEMKRGKRKAEKRIKTVMEEKTKSISDKVESEP